MPNRQSQPAARCALTLFELVLVLAVLVVLAAVVFPSAEGLYAEMRVNQAADQVRARWAEARAHAMNEGRPYRFGIVPGQGNLRLAPDSSDYWSGNTPPDRPIDGVDPPLFVEETLPPTIRLLLGDELPAGGLHLDGDSSQPPGSIDPGSWRTVAIFLPDGTAREDAELLIYGPHARPAVLRLRGLTGSVTMERPSELDTLR